MNTLTYIETTTTTTTTVTPVKQNFLDKLITKLTGKERVLITEHKNIQRERVTLVFDKLSNRTLLRRG